MKKKHSSDFATNRQAFYNYEIIEKLEAGIILTGTEVKSIRENGATLRDAYVVVSNNKVLLKECSIPLYRFGNIHNHEEKRVRQLLLHQREVDLLKKNADLKGNTIIPLSMYEKHGLVKVSIAIAKGKKLHDKRATLKEREQKRAVEKAMKESS